MFKKPCKRDVSNVDLAESESVEVVTGRFRLRQQYALREKT